MECAKSGIPRTSPHPRSGVSLFRANQRAIMGGGHRAHRVRTRPYPKAMLHNRGGATVLAHFPLFSHFPVFCYGTVQYTIQYGTVRSAPQGACPCVEALGLLAPILDITAGGPRQPLALVPCAPGVSTPVPVCRCRRGEHAASRTVGSHACRVPQGKTLRKYRRRLCGRAMALEASLQGCVL